MVAIGTSDLSHVGNIIEVSARFAGAVVSFFVVAAILLQTSVTLGLVVLIGVPLLMLAARPAAAAAAAPQRAPARADGRAANTATDIVGGLRVLRGIGGEEVFHGRYRRESQTTRARRRRRSRELQSVLDALQVFLPGSSSWSWSGSVRGSRSQGAISAGELVAFYGYSAFLMIPLRTATEFANKLIRGLVAAAASAACSRSSPRSPRPRRPAPPPTDGPTWSTSGPGCVRPRRLLTAVVAEQPDDVGGAGRPARPVRRRTDDEVRSAACR